MFQVLDPDGRVVGPVPPELSDDQLVENAGAVIAAVEKKLPQGDKNIRNAMVKFSMGKVARLSALKAGEKKKGD